MHFSHVETLTALLTNAIVIEQEQRREPKLEADFEAMLRGLSDQDRTELPAKLVQQFTRIVAERQADLHVPSLSQARDYIARRLTALDEQDIMDELIQDHPDDSGWDELLAMDIEAGLLPDA